MTFVLYLLICCAITLSFIIYGFRWQRQRQKAFLQEEMDYEETSKQ
jgi:hypothetical protein